MEFRFENKITPWDIWKLSMYHMYRSMVGLCNMVFSVAIILLTIHLWNPGQEFLMSLLILACIFFPIIQPVVVYFRSRKQVKTLPKDMVLEINDTGVHVTGDNQKAHIPWNNIRGMAKERGMVILVAQAGRGYMISHGSMGDKKEDFIRFAEEQIKNSRK